MTNETMQEFAFSRKDYFDDEDGNQRINAADIEFRIPINEFGTTWVSLLNQFVYFLRACGYNVNAENLKEFVEEFEYGMGD